MGGPNHSFRAVSTAPDPHLPHQGVPHMRRVIPAFLFVVSVSVAVTSVTQADQRAFGRVWGGTYNTQDWNRFYHYPYVYYPHNYWGSEYYRSAEDLYYRYPPEMRVPVYNKKWHNFYPEGRRYHWGHHFQLDVF
jgi:hypothetical protein